MMANFARGMFFFTIVIVSVVALLVLVPFLKEGFSFGEIPFLLGGVAVFLLLASLWWLAVSRHRAKTALGWAILALPLAAYLGMAGALALAYWNGARLSAAAALENFVEEPISWPGFDGPVGWKVSFSLIHPGNIEALLTPPEIRMGPTIKIPIAEISATRTWGGGYFKDTHREEGSRPLALLKTVGFQNLYENPTAQSAVHRFGASSHLSSEGHDQLVYRLFPGHVEYMPNDRQLCLAAETPGLPICLEGEKPENGCVRPDRQRIKAPVYHDGKDLTALWAAFGRHDLTADLSGLLTSVLRDQSLLQRNPETWISIQQHLEPEGLERAGFALCPPGDDTHTAFRVCYCR